MAGEVVVDALPYIDHGYDEAGVRESALAMVEEECRRYRPTKNYLEHLPPLNTTAFETSMMTQEFERIQLRQPMETLSMKRYELPPPSAAKLAEITAWQEAVDNSMAQLEHQSVRALNLELMVEYGCESWKAYLEIFTALQAKAQAQLQELKKQIQDINWQRKLAQTQAGERLKSLDSHWVVLVSKNYEIEQECAELEKQIQELRGQDESVENGHQGESESSNEEVESANSNTNSNDSEEVSPKESENEEVVAAEEEQQPQQDVEMNGDDNNQ